MMHGTLIQSQS